MYYIRIDIFFFENKVIIGVRGFVWFCFNVKIRVVVIRVEK